MLNHICAGGESSVINVIKTAPMNGKKPKTRLISLYLPVRCIIHLIFDWVKRIMSTNNRVYPANMEPHDMLTTWRDLVFLVWGKASGSIPEFGIKCNPTNSDIPSVRNEHTWEVIRKTHPQSMHLLKLQSETTLGRSISPQNCIVQRDSCSTLRVSEFSASEEMVPWLVQ